MSIYNQSKRLEHENMIDYKIAFLMATLALTSTFLITFSAIVNLKYSMKQYEHQKATGCRDRLKIMANYMILTIFGVFATVIPMQLLEIVRVALNCLANLATCCFPELNKLVVKKL